MIFVVCIKADIDKAVAAAKKAFQRGSVYRSMDASARAKLLWKYVKTSHHPFFCLTFLIQKFTFAHSRQLADTLGYIFIVLSLFTGWPICLNVTPIHWLAWSH